MKVLKGVRERERESFVQTNRNKELHMGIGKKTNDKTFEYFTAWSQNLQTLTNIHLNSK